MLPTRPPQESHVLGNTCAGISDGLTGAIVRIGGTLGPEHPDVAQSLEALAAKMTLAQIAEAQRLAREWKPKPE